MGRPTTGAKTGAPLGSRNGAAKLTERQVRHIKRTHLPYINTAELAKQYKVSRFTIMSIHHGITWAHVQQEREL